MIKIHNLSLAIAGKPVLKQVCFEVHRGETLAIVGESGGGKTTLARILLGLVGGRPLEQRGKTASRLNDFSWSGEVWLNGVDLLRARGEELTQIRGKQIGLIVQALSDALNPHLTVLQHIQEMLDVHDIRDTSAEENCTRYNIPSDMLNRYANSLSGGEIQRVLTALALLNQPDYLVLDEPTAALDPNNRQLAIEAFMCTSHERTQILITHDLSLAQQLADKVAVIQGGEVVELVSVEQIFSAPQHPYTQMLFASESADCAQQQAPSSGFNLAAGEPTQSITSFANWAKCGEKPTTEGLYVEKLSHQIQQRRILADISLYVPAASCLAILGPSGRGKSTFAQLLTGYQACQSGRIYWRSAEAEEKEVALGIASLVSQHPHRAMARHFTVAETLQEALRFVAKQKGRQKPNKTQLNTNIQSLLGDVGLPTDEQFLQRKTAALSGGEAQRLVIARALAANPAVLVADEPTSALDMRARQQIIALLERLKTERGLTIILFTHDYSTAQALADEIAEL